MSYRNSGTTTGPNSWVPGNTQNKKAKETYNEILNNFETLANRFERGQLGKNQILYPKQAIWSKNKKYYTYFDFEGNLFVFDKNDRKKWMYKNDHPDKKYGFMGIGENGDLAMFTLKNEFLWGAKKEFNLKKDVHYLKITDEGVLQLLFLWYDVIWDSK